MFDLLPKHQHQDEHRLLHRKSSALWEEKKKKCWMGQDEALGRNRPPFSAGTRCRLFHVVHVDLRVGEAFHHRPFVSQPCRTLGLSRGSRCWFDFQHGIGSSRLQHICVFSHQCVLVQYDGCLMLKQDRYYDIRQNFFLTNGFNLLYHLPHMCRADRCFMRIFYDKSVLVIQGICFLEIY